MQPGANPIEKIKAEKNGLDLLQEIEAFSRMSWQDIPKADLETRLKWIGVFFRKRTPGDFMMRVRMANGQSNARQFRVLGEIAEKMGNGVLEITTRQQIELRAVQIKDVPEIFEKLEGIDLTSLQTGMDNIRNVNTCPLAGLSPRELLDASPVSLAFQQRFLGNRDYTNLPRKMNVTITGCMENCTHVESQDIGLVAAIRHNGDQRIIGFNVFVGGKMGSGGFTVASPLNVFVTPEEAPALCEAITFLFRDEGQRGPRNRVRLAFLIEQWGIGRFRDELQKRWGGPLLLAEADQRLPVHTDHLGVNAQKQKGLFSVGVAVPVGRVNSKHMFEFVRLAETYGTGDLRLTTAQNVIFINIPKENLTRLLDEPILQEFSPQAHPFLRGLVSCIGTDYCNLALIETKGIAKQLAKTLIEKGIDPGPITMNWSGCPAGCGNHQAADIGFQGIKANVDGEVVDAVHIFVGGHTGPNARAGEKIMELVPVSMLPDIIPMLIKNLSLLRKVKRDTEAEKRVLMVPAEAVYE